MREIRNICFEDICNANKTISTTDIKGKEYAEVNQRIKAFRMVYPCGSINTEMKSNELHPVDKIHVCIIKATITDENGNILGTGMAYEKENSSFINKTSYIENCETSAVGRALGMCGFGIDTSVASAEEVINAMNNQKINKPKKENTTNYRTILINLCKQKGINMNDIVEKYGVTKESTNEEFKKICEDLRNE